MKPCEPSLVDALMSSNEYAINGTTAIMPYMPDISEADVRAYIARRKGLCIAGKVAPIEPSGKTAMQLLASYRVANSEPGTLKKAYKFEYAKCVNKNSGKRNDIHSSVIVTKKIIRLRVAAVRGLGLAHGSYRCDIGFDYLERAVSIALNADGEFSICVFGPGGRPLSAVISCSGLLERIRKIAGELPHVELYSDGKSLVLTKREVKA